MVKLCRDPTYRFPSSSAVRFLHSSSRPLPSSRKSIDTQKSLLIPTCFLSVLPSQHQYLKLTKSLELLIKNANSSICSWIDHSIDTLDQFSAQPILQNGLQFYHYSAQFFESRKTVYSLKTIRLLTGKPWRSLPLQRVINNPINLITPNQPNQLAFLRPCLTPTVQARKSYSILIQPLSIALAALTIQTNPFDWCS